MLRNPLNLLLPSVANVDDSPSRNPCKVRTAACSAINGRLSTASYRNNPYGFKVFRSPDRATATTLTTTNTTTSTTAAAVRHSSQVPNTSAIPHSYDALCMTTARRQLPLDEPTSTNHSEEEERGGEEGAAAEYSSDSLIPRSISAIDEGDDVTMPPLPVFHNNTNASARSNPHHQRSSSFTTATSSTSSIIASTHPTYNNGNSHANGMPPLVARPHMQTPPTAQLEQPLPPLPPANFRSSVIFPPTTTTGPESLQRRRTRHPAVVVGFKHIDGVFELPDNGSNSPYRSGDYVVVEGDRGEHVGRISQCNLLHRHCLKGATIGHVIRHACGEEVALVEEVRRREGEAITLCQTCADELGVEMKIVDTELQTDFNKITIYYVPKIDGPVDFRQLQRRLFREFRCRIWFVNWDEF